MSQPHVYSVELGGGLRVAVEVPGDGSRLTGEQFDKIITLLRGTADELERQFLAADRREQPS